MSKFSSTFWQKKNQKRSCTVHCVIVRKGRKRNRYLKRKSRKKEKVKKECWNKTQRKWEHENPKISPAPEQSLEEKERKIYLFSGKRKRSYNIQIFFSFTSFPPFLSGDTPFDSGNSKTSDLSPEKKLSELSRHNFHKQNYRRLTKLILVRASMAICQVSAWCTWPGNSIHDDGHWTKAIAIVPQAWLTCAFT